MSAEITPAELGRRALFAPLAAFLARFDAPGVPAPDVLDTLLGPAGQRARSAGGKALCFAAPLAGARGYESRVYRDGVVGTRPGNWHDFFNALVWMAFPRTKAALNAVHCTSPPSAVAGRGPRRDAATQFDESGVIVACADPALPALLRARRWRELFWDRREDVVARMRFLVFGHGLYDSLRRPFIGLCGKAILIDVDEAFVRSDSSAQLRALDDRCASLVADPLRLPSPKVLLALPVLGIPGVVPENGRPEYYDDRRQFRGSGASGLQCCNSASGGASSRRQS